MGEEHTWLNSTVHAVAGGSILIDLLCGANRPVDTHVFIVAGVAFLYSMVNLAVTKVSGIPLYSVLPWDDGPSFILAVGALGGVIVIFFLISTVAWLRDRCARKGRRCCAWKSSRRPASTGPGAFTTGVYSDVHEGLNALSHLDDDMEDSDDEDYDTNLGWYATEASRNLAATHGNSALTDGHILMFSGPRFTDTRKGFPCSTCHANSCRGSGGNAEPSQQQGWQSGNAAPQTGGMGESFYANLAAAKDFTGTESDARSDTLYPI